MKITRKTIETKDGNYTMKELTSERLLAEYAEKPVRKVLQIDCWSGPSDERRGGPDLGYGGRRNGGCS